MASSEQLHSDFQRQMEAGRGLLSDSQQKLSRIVQAEQHFRSALELFPRNIEAMLCLAQCFEHQGRGMQAKDYYERVLHIDPQCDIARQRHANIVATLDTAPTGTFRVIRFPETITELSADLDAAIRTYCLSHIDATAIDLKPDSKIITFGSCFAANIAHALNDAGYATTNLTVGEAVNSTYANLELVEWALGFPVKVSEQTLQIFSSTRDAVKALLHTADVMIYTLGVAPCFFEAETSAFAMPTNSDGVRGTISGKYIFRNTTVDENYDNLRRIVARVREVNPSCRMVFSLSPVPVAATLEQRSALEADCLSKATLRVTVDKLISTTPDCLYWPAFEMVRWLGAYVPGMYGDEDGSTYHVSERVIATIMRLFIETFKASTPLVS